MPGKYLWQGIQLQYPENWSVQEDEDGLSIESPTGSFLTISCPENIDQSFEQARRTMEEEYEEVESEPLSRVVGESLLEGITQRFVYLDLIVTSQLFRLFDEDEQVAPLLIQIQGEDRELEQQQPVFDAILASLSKKC